MPEARHRCRSSSVAWAVMAMIGKLAKRRSALRWVVAWKPSISGIWRSINTRSNGGGCGPSERICTPSRPLPATRTVAPAPSSSSTAICWLISLSSDEEDSRAPEPARLLVRGHARDSAPASWITEEIHERVHDHRLGDGLDEEAVEMEPLGLFADFLAAERGDEHDRGPVGQRLVALDPADRLVPVQAGHAPVHEDEVVRRRRVGLPDGRDGFGGGGDHVDAAHDGPQWLLQDLAGGGIVVDHEHAETREAFGDDPAGGPGGAQLEPGGEGERAARAGLALQPDAPAHQLDEPPRDREPEPGAAVLARGRHVGLGEGLEEAGRLLSGHADPGVAHGELQLDLVAGTLEQTDREPDLATFGELHRVVDQVGEDLSETERITAQVLGDRARDVGQELQPLVVGLLGGERDDRADDLVDLEVRGLEVELARLDLREVEDVVDDAG